MAFAYYFRFERPKTKYPAIAIKMKVTATK